jgi:hypothetical protein
MKFKIFVFFTDILLAGVSGAILGAALANNIQ